MPNVRFLTESNKIYITFSANNTIDIFQYVQALGITQKNTQINTILRFSNGWTTDPDSRKTRPNDNLSPEIDFEQVKGANHEEKCAVWLVILLIKIMD
jgi:hypothetical protein